MNIRAGFLIVQIAKLRFLRSAKHHATGSARKRLVEMNASKMVSQCTLMSEFDETHTAVVGSADVMLRALQQQQDESLCCEC